MNDEKEVFLKIRKGDPQSFEILFRTYYAPLCHFARQYLADRDDCEELVQAFFLKIWEKREELDISTSVRNYLFRAVRNHCLNFIKHQKIVRQHHDEVLKNSEAGWESRDYILEADLEDKIRQGIDSLPQRRKEIFLLSRDEGLKYREIADRLGISIKTVETQMGQALKDLREKLKDYRQLLIGFILLRMCPDKGKR
ncbi:MAG TPA: RNA polymerase sigma-70 factor [Prolixibacteraceae bacterium]|nr:RNA polymerase sigma-70 factor [Prolixibacteraceae bacterium]